MRILPPLRSTAIPQNIVPPAQCQCPGYPEAALCPACERAALGTLNAGRCACPDESCACHAVETAALQQLATPAAVAVRRLRTDPARTRRIGGAL